MASCVSLLRCLSPSFQRFINRFMWITNASGVVIWMLELWVDSAGRWSAIKITGSVIRIAISMADWPSWLLPIRILHRECFAITRGMFELEQKKIRTQEESAWEARSDFESQSEKGFAIRALTFDACYKRLPPLRKPHRFRVIEKLSLIVFPRRWGDFSGLTLPLECD